MDLPRKTDKKSKAYWKVIDEAAKNANQIVNRQKQIFSCRLCESEDPCKCLAILRKNDAHVTKIKAELLQSNQIPEIKKEVKEIREEVENIRQEVRKIKSDLKEEFKELEAKIKSLINSND